jgi:hypothetical protein
MDTEERIHGEEPLEERDGCENNLLAQLEPGTELLEQHGKVHIQRSPLVGSHILARTSERTR